MHTNGYPEQYWTNVLEREHCETILELLTNYFNLDELTIDEIFLMPHGDSNI